MRLKIQVMREEVEAGKGGSEVAITVMDSRIPEAVLGIALTTVHRGPSTFIPSG